MIGPARQSASAIPVRIRHAKNNKAEISARFQAARRAGFAKDANLRISNATNENAAKSAAIARTGACVIGG